MARPQKKGLDYFPLDTDFFRDRKIRRLHKNCDFQGVTVFIYLCTIVYNDHGYYASATDDDIFDYSDELKVSEKELKNIIDKCCQFNLFDTKMYEDNKILTSSGIQRRYLKICKESKRKNYMIGSNHLLLSSQEVLELNGVNPELTGINSELTDINPELIGVNSELSTQSKVKERIEKKRRENEKNQIFSSHLFSSFCEKLDTTLKKHLKYIGGGDLDDYCTLFFYLVESSLIDIKDPQKLTVGLIHNYACYMLESLSDIDHENFTIAYWVKHYNRINSGLNAKLKRRVI